MMLVCPCRFAETTECNYILYYLSYTSAGDRINHILTALLKALPALQTPDSKVVPLRSWQCDVIRKMRSHLYEYLMTISVSGSLQTLHIVSIDGHMSRLLCYIHNQ